MSHFLFSPIASSDHVPQHARAREVPFGLPQLLTSAVCTRCGTARDVQKWSSGPRRCWKLR